MGDADTGIHLVLSGGGMRALAYIGALQAFEAAGVEVASVAGVSAGAVIGALIAAGYSGNDLERLVVESEVLPSIRVPPWLSALRALRRWPFAAYDPTRWLNVIGGFIGAGRTFQDLAIPFATMGVDVVHGEYLVYTEETHPTMRVIDAVRIAASVPLLCPPHECDDRIIVDAGVATNSPVWLAATMDPYFDEVLPIVVLRPALFAPVRRPRRLRPFLTYVATAAVLGGDNPLIRGNPRVHAIDLPTAGVSVLRHDLGPAERARVVRIGRSATEQAIDRAGGDFTAAQSTVRSAAARLRGGREEHRAREHDEIAAWAGAHYAREFLAGPARDVFVSYAHEDRPWFHRLRRRLHPLESSGTIRVWSDEDIPPGTSWHRQIHDAIGQARAALLLVSPSYLGSDFIAAEELPALLRAAERRRTVLLWIHVSEATYKPTRIGQLQAAHDIARPLDSLAPPALDATLGQIADQVTRVVRARPPGARATRLAGAPSRA